MEDAGQRRDARRNRDRILAAAQELFGDSAAVPMYEVARRAGVGQATLYRHFPDRQALLDATWKREFSELALFAAEHANRPDGVILLLQDLAQRMARLSGLAEVTRAASSDVVRGARHDEINALFAQPLDAAKAAGTVRTDLQLEDVFRMIVMIEGAIIDEPDPIRRTLVARRAQQLLVEGMCAQRPSVGRRRWSPTRPS